MKILSNGSERLMLLSWEGILSWRRRLGEAGLLRGHVAPLLDDGLLDRSGVGSGPGADLLGDIHTLLDRGKLGHQLGHVLAGPLGLEGAGLLGGVLDNGLLLRIADLLSLLESTASGGAELPGLLGTSGDGGVLTDRLLGDAANLPGPFFAISGGSVSGGLLLALLLNLSFAVDNIILDFMDLLLGPALGLSAADLRSLNVAILENRSSADLDSLVEGNLLVLDETALSEVLLALLLLLGVVVGDVGGVAPLVVAMVTLDHVIVLNLPNHLDLVNTSLAFSVGSSSGDIIEAGWVFLDSCLSLTIISGSEVLDRIPGCVISVISMMVMVVMVTLIIGVEGEGVDKRPGVSALLHTPELSAAKDALAANGEDEKQLCIHVVSFDEPSGALRTRTLLRSDSH